MSTVSTPRSALANRANQFLFLDAYGTLVELDGFFQRLQAGFAQHDVMVPDAAVARAARAEMAYYIANSVRAADTASLDVVRAECAQVLAESLRSQGYALQLPAAAVQRILVDAIAFRPFPDVAEALEELYRSGIPMAVLSNWDFQIESVFEALQLRRFFNFVLSSSRVGSEKPSARFFMHGLQQAQALLPDLQVERCIYVGDHYHKDVQGAQAVGMRPVWLMRDEAHVKPEEVAAAGDAVVRIACLSELRQLLSGL